MGDIIVIVGLIIIVFFVFQSLWKNRNNKKGCDGNCVGCHQSCSIDFKEIHRNIKDK